MLVLLRFLKGVWKFKGRIVRKSIYTQRRGMEKVGMRAVKGLGHSE